MSVTIKDVAREAGVSISTVSKILNSVPGISEATTRRVEEVMARLDYAPNSRAASLARKSARCIAFVARLDEYEPYKNPHLFDIMCGVQEALYSKGYGFLLLDSLRADVEKMMLSRAFDGVIVHGGALSKAMHQLLVNRKFPHIVIGHPSDTRINWVDTDNALGGRIAVEHLSGCGCRDVAFIGALETDDISNERLVGFCAAAEENGCEYRESWIKHTDGTLQSGRAAALELLTAPDRPDAVVCSSNLLAFAFAEAAHELGVSIPDGVQLITFDRYPYSPLIVPEPTLVQIDVRDMGRVAAKQLLQELKKPELRVQSFTTLPSLIVGKSTREI